MNVTAGLPLVFGVYLNHSIGGSRGQFGATIFGQRVVEWRLLGINVPPIWRLSR